MNFFSSRNFKLLLFSVISVSVIFLCCEILLTIVGFKYDSRPRYMEFNFPNPHELREIFEPDPVLLWKLRPGVVMGAGIEPINSKGFRGKEFSDEKRKGIKRVIAVGDSVTFGGEVSYPALLEKCLGPSYEVINAGVPGYSSFQGLRLVETRLLGYKPDVLLVMYGWNDHWLAWGFSDSEQRFSVADSSEHFSVLRNLKIFQFLSWLLSGSKRATPKKFRVPLSEYQANLRKIVALAKANSVELVLLTAPSALKLGMVPDFLFHLKFIDGDQREPQAQTAFKLKKLHESYNDVVRQIAMEDNNVKLVDISRQWDSMDISKLFRDPSKDVIHPNADGYRLIAQTICDTLLLRKTF